MQGELQTWDTEVFGKVKKQGQLAKQLRGAALNAVQGAN
jgi:hypothetical protein